MHTSPGAAASPLDVRPTAEGDRLEVLDAMRGFALGGIFLLNLAVFSGFAFMTPEMMSASPTAAVDLPVAGLVVWLGYGKFYSLFSLLFGIGFSLQLAAAVRRGDERLRVFKRRLLVLVAIGAVHLYIWEGDILVLYALVGFFLIPFRRLPDRTLLRSSVALVFAPVLLEVLIVATHGALDPGAPLLRAGDAALVATGFPAGTMPFPVLRDAGWAEYFRFQLSGVFFRYADLLSTGRPFKVLAMFVLGLWVGRSGMLTDMTPWLPTLRRMRVWCFAVGLPAAAMHAMLMLGGIGRQRVAEGRRRGGLRARRRAAGARIRVDVRDPLAVRGVARPARAPGPGRTHGADQLPDPHHRRDDGVLWHRIRPDGPAWAGVVAAHGRRHDLGAGGPKPLVAGAVRVRTDGVDLAPGDLRPSAANSACCLKPLTAERAEDAEPDKVSLRTPPGSALKALGRVGKLESAASAPTRDLRRARRTLRR